MDKIVERKELKQTLETILRLHRKEEGTAGGNSARNGGEVRKQAESSENITGSLLSYVQNRPEP